MPTFPVVQGLSGELDDHFGYLLSYKAGNHLESLTCDLTHSGKLFM